MRRLLLATILIVPAMLVGAHDVVAQGTPSADQIIRALRPVGPVQSGTRGIRPAATPPAALASTPPATTPLAGAAAAPPVAALAEPRTTAAPAQAQPPAAAQSAVVTPAVPPAAAPSIDLTVQFQTGSAELTPDAMRTLDQLGRALSSDALAAYRFRIEGHTDTTGSREVNMTLSQARAARVADYLQAKFGVAPSRLESVGRGQQALKVATPDQTPEPRNRRVQVINIGV